MADTGSTTDDDEDGRAKLLLAVVTFAAVVPLFVARHLPFTDLPEHAAVASAFVHWNDPTFRIAEHYVVAFPRTPYVLFHLVAAGLTTVVGSAELAVRLLLAAIGIALPLSVRSLLGAFGLDRRLALFAPLVFWNRALAIGLLPFVAAMPLLVWAIAGVVRNGRAPTNRRRLLLAGLGLLLFYLHPSSWVVFVATAVVSTVHARGARGSVREAIWLSPSVLGAIAWLVFGKIAVGGDGFLRATEIDYLTPRRALFAFPLWLHDVWKTHVDEGCAIVWWTSLLVLALASMRAPLAKGFVARLLPLLCALAVYFATPHHAGVGVFLNVRLAPLLALFALPIVRAPRGALSTKAALAGATIASLVMSVVSAREIRRAEEKEMTGFDAMIDRMRPGARVISLNFDIKSEHAQFAPWLYAVAYHRIRRGGVTAYSFVSFDHWPIRYTTGGAPPAKAEPFWATNPCVFRNAEDGAYYDYLLARGDTDPFADEPPGPRWTLIGQATKFRLYERLAGNPWPPWDAADRGPCVPRNEP